MARYIDADRYSFPTLHRKELNDYMKGWNACLKSVLQQPTADVVEVVRCRDCKYRKLDKLFQEKHYCYLRNVNGGKYCNDDDFCSYGERRTDNDLL